MASIRIATANADSSLSKTKLLEMAFPSHTSLGSVLSPLSACISLINLNQQVVHWKGKWLGVGGSQDKSG